MPLHALSTCAHPQSSKLYYTDSGIIIIVVNRQLLGFKLPGLYS